MTAWRRRTRRVAHRAGEWGRRLGLLRYQPERRTAEQWTAAYEAGQLGYYGGLDELARYSVIVGYIGWFAAAGPARRPSVLDVGCGTGLLRERLEGVEFAEYVGVDLSHAAIGAARSRGHPRSRFVVGDASALDLGRFDVVVLNEVLYYAPEPAAFLQQMRAILQPDGVLIVSMWRHGGDRWLWRCVADAFPIVDRVEVRNRANPVNPRGWLVACYRASGSGARGAVAGGGTASAQGDEAETALGGEGSERRKSGAGGRAVDDGRGEGALDGVVEEHHVTGSEGVGPGHYVAREHVGLPVPGIDRPEPGAQPSSEHRRRSPPVDVPLGRPEQRHGPARGGLHLGAAAPVLP